MEGPGCDVDCQSCGGKSVMDASEGDTVGIATADGCCGGRGGVF